MLLLYLLRRCSRASPCTLHWSATTKRPVSRVGGGFAGRTSGTKTARNPDCGPQQNFPCSLNPHSESPLRYKTFGATDGAIEIGSCGTFLVLLLWPFFPVFETRAPRAQPKSFLRTGLANLFFHPRPFRFFFFPLHDRFRSNSNNWSFFCGEQRGKARCGFNNHNKSSVSFCISNAFP